MSKNKDVRNVFYLLLFVIVFCGIATINFRTMKENIEKSIIIIKQGDVSKAASEIDNFLLDSSDTIKRVSYVLDNMQSEKATEKELLKYLENETDLYSKAISKNFTGIYGVFDGKYLDGSGWVPDKGYVPEERPWYKKALEEPSEVVFVDPYMDLQTNKMTMSISKLLSDRKSVVSLDASLDGLREKAQDMVVNGDWRFAAVLDSNGYVVAHSDEREIGKHYLDEDRTDGNLLARRLYSADKDYFDVNLGGNTYTVFYTKIGNEWYGLAAAEKRRIFSSVGYIYIFIFISSAMVIGFAIFAFFYLRGLYRRENELGRRLKAVALTYVSMHVIDIDNDTFTEIADNAEDLRAMLANKNSHAQNVMRIVMDSLTDERFKKSIYEFVNFSTLDERLKENDFISKEFIDNKNVRCRGRFITLEKDENGHISKVVWVVEYI